MDIKKCNDCMSFSHRDAFKGFCLTKQKDAIIDKDAITCDSYAKTDKCKFCTRYKSGAGPEYSRGALGQCQAQSVMVYADLKACSAFNAGKVN